MFLISVLGCFLVCCCFSIVLHIIGWAVRRVWTGLDWTGLDWTGLDWTGLDWTGLDWTGLDWTGLDWTACTCDWFVVGAGSG
jgi:hypothetical protein